MNKFYQQFLKNITYHGIVIDELWGDDTPETTKDFSEKNVAFDSNEYDNIPDLVYHGFTTKLHIAEMIEEFQTDDVILLAEDYDNYQKVIRTSKIVNVCLPFVINSLPDDNIINKWVQDTVKINNPCFLFGSIKKEGDFVLLKGAICESVNIEK